MSILSTTTTAMSGAARVVADVATAPVRVVTALLDTPHGVEGDPRSSVLASLRAEGWRPVAVRLDAPTATVELARDGQHQRVEGTSLAFAVYATRLGFAAGATVTADSP